MFLIFFMLMILWCLSSEFLFEKTLDSLRVLFILVFGCAITYASRVRKEAKNQTNLFDLVTVVSEPVVRGSMKMSNSCEDQR